MQPTKNRNLDSHTQAKLSYIWVCPKWCWGNHGLVVLYALPFRDCFSACFLRRRVSESEHGCICIVMMKGWGLAMDRLYNRNIREYDIANMY